MSWETKSIYTKFVTISGLKVNTKYNFRELCGNTIFTNPSVNIYIRKYKCDLSKISLIEGIRYSTYITYSIEGDYITLKSNALNIKDDEIVCDLLVLESLR